MTAVVVLVSVNMLHIVKYAYCGDTKPLTVIKGSVQYVPSFRPFEFAYQSNDGLGTTQHRRESSNSEGSVKGTYGYIDPFGVYRAVEYVADTNGFRAVVKTNEPGTASQNTADAVWVVQPPPSTVQPTPSVPKLAKNSPLQLKIQPANFTAVASSSTSNIFYSKQQIHPTILQLPFPILTSSNGIVTVHVPPSSSTTRKRTAKITPRSVATV